MANKPDRNEEKNNNETITSSNAGSNGYHTFLFSKMVPRVDVLVSAAPSTPKTRKMFNEQVFRSMKKTSYFLGMSLVNVVDKARGY